MDNPRLSCDCKNCQVVQRMRRGMLGIARPAGPGYQDRDIESWNHTLEQYPCLKETPLDRPKYGWGWIDGEDDNEGDRWIQISELDYTEDADCGYLGDEELCTIMLRDYKKSVARFPGIVEEREANAKMIVDALNAQATS